MLGKLLKTLKSEKSSKGVFKQEIESNQKSQNYSANTIQSYKIDSQLTSHGGVVQGKIERVRYFVLKNMPNIFNQVLGCPISVFHFLPHGGRKVKEIYIPDHQMPAYLQFLTPVLAKEIPTYNHILINDYPPGIGIMPHSDGPAYHPKVFVLSLNSYCIINFQKSYNSSDSKVSISCRVLLEPNSIHIFQNEAYTQQLHGIDNYQIDSILLKYCQEQKKVIRANVDNYGLLSCKDRIQEQIRKGETETNMQNGVIRLVKLEGNEEYSHKIEITRKQRISITIRQKYL